eukprot:scaffold120518_cov20-Tisochrysis_lutea.AAC.3
MSLTMSSCRSPILWSSCHSSCYPVTMPSCGYKASSCHPSRHPDICSHQCHPVIHPVILLSPVSSCQSTCYPAIPVVTSVILCLPVLVPPKASQTARISCLFTLSAIIHCLCAWWIKTAYHSKRIPCALAKAKILERALMCLQEHCQVRIPLQEMRESSRPREGSPAP